jgi:hypothetical protein
MDAKGAVPSEVRRAPLMLHIMDVIPGGMHGTCSPALLRVGLVARWRGLEDAFVKTTRAVVNDNVLSDDLLTSPIPRGAGKTT